MLKISITILCCLIVTINCAKNCKNIGISTTVGGIDYCVCHKNFIGDLCEKEFALLSQNEKDRLGCATKPCWFGSTCEDLTHLNGTFRCHCSANTFGTYCEKSTFDSTDPCITTPCYNGGQCEPLDAFSYKCKCNGNDGGTGCKQSMSGGCFMGAATCQRESVCVPIGQNDYKCNCVDWTLGRYCDNVFNPCQLNPCANGATCLKRRTLAYECQCQTGFVGLRCDQRIENSCLSNPCKEGKCLINEFGQYNCTCDGSFIGEYCPKGCNPSCKKGVCKQVSTGFYRCECPANYKGADCSQLSCFPEDMMVETKEHGKIEISELKSGYHVKTFDAYKNTWKYTKFLTYLHKDETLVTTYYTIKTNENKILKLSADHLIAKFNSNKQTQDFIFAKDIKIGDLLLNQETNDLVKVENIETEIEKGAYAPLTEDGTIYVNDILVSCYANIQSHKVAHFAMQPLIFLSKFFNIGSNSQSQTFNGESFWYSDFLFNFVNNLPSKLSNFIFTVKL